MESSFSPRLFSIALMERPDPASIPSLPGVYFYKDAQGTILYIGKARILRKRVLSYFRPTGLAPKTCAMLSHAASLSFITTTTEKEALLLEASLIKKHHPHYNIALRDDKQYFLFRIDCAQTYPRLEIVRQVRNDKARYFGPFTSATAARDTWKLLHKTFGLRRCSDSAMRNRVRPCLYHHMHQCLAPCMQAVSPSDYKSAVGRILALLEGRTTDLIEELTASMEEHSQALRYEEAAIVRDQIRAIERTIEQQAVILPGSADMDVVALSHGEKGLAIAVLFVRAGSICESRPFYWPALELTDAKDLLLTFLAQFYALQLPPPRILLPWRLEKGAPTLQQTNLPCRNAEEGACPEAAETIAELCEEKDFLARSLSERRGGKVELAVAQNEQEEQLLDVALTNAKEEARRKEQASGETLLGKVAASLHLQGPLHRIECVDVSHTGGTDCRVGMVVYIDGEPSKSDYRIYKMPQGADDYASLAHWVGRRLESGPPWPDLLLIDGGKSQIQAVLQALMAAQKEKLFPLAAIAKAKDARGRPDRHFGNVADRIFLPERVNPLPLREGCAELLFLQQIRDATHHFAIQSHRKAHAKTQLHSSLLALPFIGEKRARRLWETYPSLEAMRACSAVELQKLLRLSASQATQLREHLQNLGAKPTSHSSV